MILKATALNTVRAAEAVKDLVTVILTVTVAVTVGILTTGGVSLVVKVEEYDST